MFEDGAVDGAGHYEFRTVLPRTETFGLATDSPLATLTRALQLRGVRPLHIHSIVSADGCLPPATQIYFDGDPAHLRHQPGLAADSGRLARSRQLRRAGSPADRRAPRGRRGGGNPDDQGVISGPAGPGSPPRSRPVLPRP
ncbi:hypothetical protein AB0F52_43835 [Amycolatopsis sp. NPDC024027]|uniref:dioxygenase family protein n=1 Tax=Amycolatopsis sp. NPDC024027 TaxID=3154327 RepID=UPI0033C22242